jgi:hypothetical protein
MEDGRTGEPFRARTLLPLKSMVGWREKLIARSPQEYATPRDVVENKLNRWMKS